MTIPTQARPESGTSLLPDASQLALRLLADDRPAEQRLTGALRTAAHREMSAALSDLLHVDVTEQLAQAWRRLDELVDAAQETAAQPGLREVIELVDHTFTFRRGARLSVRLDDVPLWEIPLDVALRLDITGLVATVVGGRIVAVTSGRCDVSGTVGSGDVSVATRTLRVSLPAELRLGTGLPLLPAGGPIPRQGGSSEYS